MQFLLVGWQLASNKSFIYIFSKDKRGRGFQGKYIMDGTRSNLESIYHSIYTRAIFALLRVSFKHLLTTAQWILQFLF